MDKENSYNDQDIIKAEAQRLKVRRRLAGVKAGKPGEDAIGLCLSGGGIRSATFNLGLLQALSSRNQLKNIDYLSTVSGGGYIGASLTWFMTALNRAFPFGTRRSDNREDAGRLVAWLRTHGNYLIPGGGLNLWALFAAVLTGTLATLAVLIPVFIGLVWWLAQPQFTSMALPFASYLSVPEMLTIHRGFAWIFYAAIWALLSFVVLAFVFAIATRWVLFRTLVVQRLLRVVMGALLMFAVIALVVGAIPWVYDLLTSEWLRTWMSSLSVAGVLSFLAGLKGRKGGNELHGRRALMLTLGLTLFIYGLFLWFFHLMVYEAQLPQWLVWSLWVSLTLAVLANINHVSMHRFYRNRLMEAYMPQWSQVSNDAKNGNEANPDNCRISELQQTAAPYHIVNTNIQLTGSHVAKYRARAGDNFIFSPLLTGSNATGFVPSEVHLNGNMNLATAMAISGAAVNPNTYLTRSKPLTFIMTLFNLRLGYWVRNPRHPAWLGPLSRPRWYWYLFREMFGDGLHENQWHVHLSDGGHFENLGLYELVRRRCKKIIVSDASADPDWTFEDLARAIELVRVDFGAKIELDVTALKPDANRRSKAGFVKGKISYAPLPGEKKLKLAELVYVKTALVNKLQEDVYGYDRKHPDFPDEAMSDQFFDEFQFEAYRELGYQIGKGLS